MPHQDSNVSPQGKYLPANGLNIYYEEYGSGQPLILLHGGTETSQMWQPFLSSFVPHFRVIVPDSRAHGRTNNPGSELSYHLMAEDVVALIQALHLTQPFIFGYSDGGQIALEIGMRYPGLTAALIVGAAWYKFSEIYTNFLTTYGFEDPGVVNIEKLQRVAPDWVSFLKSEHVHSGDTDYWQTLLRQISVLWWTPLNYTEDDFHKMTDPTLVLVGDRDGLIELQQALDMYHLIPNAELVVLPNTTHLSALNDLSMYIVLEFLRRHAAATGKSNAEDAS